jgi:hypothetical protein
VYACVWYPNDQNVARGIKKTGKVVVPGVAMVKTRLKPATKAGKREV